MESFAIYLIKVNVALIVLYAFYKLSFSKDTFFRLRRIMLLLICVTSLIYPLIDFSGWTDEYAIGETFTTVYNKLLPEVLVTTALPVATTEVEVTTWQTGIWVWIIYGLGIGIAATTSATLWWTASATTTSSTRTPCGPLPTTTASPCCARTPAWQTA